jgi:Uma2 family endonuclease
MATTSQQLTIEDFERLPSEQAKNHELIDGELVAVSGNSLNHNSLRDLLIAMLYPIVRERKLGTVVAEQEYDFDGNAHGPDVTFFGQAKQALADLSKRVQRFVPDLAIEIVSQNDTFQSLWRKKDRYRRCGTREVWIISMETEEIFVYAERGNVILKGQDTIQTDLIPGFSISVDHLFQSR